MSINFRGSRRDETQILRSELNSNKLEIRRKAVKKVSPQNWPLICATFALGYRSDDGGQRRVDAFHARA